MKKNCFRFLLVALVALTTVPMYGQRPILKAKTPNLQLRGLQIIAHAVGRNHWVNPSPPVPNPGPQPPIITSVSPNVPTIPKIKMPDFKPSPRLSAAERQKVEDFRNREQLYRQGLQQLKKGNLKSARSLFKRSADNGQYVPAKYEYGKMLIADGDTASIKMGIQQLFSAAVMGNEDAMFDLGWAYTQWPSFSPKPSINLFWLCRSGEKGNPLGDAYAGNILNEKNDTAKALLLWERAYANRKKTYRGSMPKEEARQLMSLAMYNLGSHITLAKHIYAEAVSYLDYAHTLGNVDAGAMLGWIYATDNTGVKDVQKALPLLEEGAKQNNEIACWALAELYMNGEDVPRDSVKALQYYKVAADSGDVYSTERVVSCYYEANDYDNALSYATRDYMAQHLQTIFVAGQCLKRCDYFFESLNKTLCLRFHILLYGRQKKSPAFDASLKTERIFQTINIIADSLIGFGQCLRLLCLHMILLDKFEQNNPVKRAAKIHMETLPFFHGICQRQFARYQFPQEFHLDQFFILLHFLVINFLQGQIFPLISDFLGNLRQMFQQNC